MVAAPVLFEGLRAVGACSGRDSAGSSANFEYERAVRRETGDLGPGIESIISVLPSSPGREEATPILASSARSTSRAVSLDARAAPASPPRRTTELTDSQPADLTDPVPPLTSTSRPGSADRRIASPASSPPCHRSPPRGPARERHHAKLEPQTEDESPEELFQDRRPERYRSRSRSPPPVHPSTPTDRPPPDPTERDSDEEPSGTIVTRSGRRLPDHRGRHWWRSVHLQIEGPIVRHVSLTQGAEELESRRARQRREDAASTAGLRGTAEVIRRHPAWVEHSRDICARLRRARGRCTALQGLHHAGGPNPTREPPPAEAIAVVRRELALCFDDLSPADVERHHPASPWRWSLFKAMADRFEDPDTEIPFWLKQGAPMGLHAPIVPGGHFPQTAPDADVRIDSVDPMTGDDLNHGSFRAEFGDDPESAGLALVRHAVAAGFGEVFADRQSAATALGGPVLPAPLGTVSKERATGGWKHRLIQDLRVNGVNAAVGLPERLVLPRPVDLGKDLAELAAQREPGDGLKVGIVDFADAFMSVPLAGAERRFNCAELPVPLTLGRAPLHPDEPPAGRLIAWRVLGFGGRPNPLIFGRITSMLMRFAQAILTARPDLPAGAADPQQRRSP